jgi:hypothetical protein
MKTGTLLTPRSIWNGLWRMPSEVNSRAAKRKARERLLTKDVEAVEAPWITALCIRVELKLPDVAAPPKGLYYQADPTHLRRKVVCDPQVTDLIHAVSGTEVPSATKNRSVSAESKQAITGASACNR